ncbi:GtrA family protein [Paenibacillus chitinolyticus]|uniref:GtrA family protein n=1 Tax=Paenibacillus chitinolyticus TaxID=79263 RepID=UPI0036DB9C1D
MLKFKKRLSQFFKYGVIGIIGTAVHTGTLAFLVEIYHIKPLVASICGFIVSLVISYFLNSRFTFSQRRNVYVFIKYCVVSLTGLFLNLVLLFLVVNILNSWYVYGQVLSIVIVPICNFTLNKVWAFKSKPIKETDTP